MKRKTIIVAGVVVGCLAILGAAVNAIGLGDFLGGDPGQTARINERLLMVRSGNVDMYLVQSGEEYIAFDACDSLETEAEGLKKLGVDPQAVKALFLTHSDYDHVSAAALFSNATVYLPKKETSYLDGSRKRRMLHFIVSKMALPVERYETLEEGQTVEACSMKIASIPMPGHTVGSTAYLVDGILMAGDALLLKGGKAVQPMKVFTEDMEEARRSIAAVAAVPGISAICTGHTGYEGDAVSAFSGWAEKD